MNTGKITAPFRKIGLMHLVDKSKFWAKKIRNYQKNNSFIKKHPTINLPPDYLMFESYKLDYDKYYFGGKKSATWIVEQAEKYISLEGKKILDWGCGPSRIIRHLPEIIGNGCSFYGTDYNPKTIKWCQSNIPNVDFRLNGLNPPLDYEAQTFDFIYGISIFTHLSEKNHYDWFDELMRISKNGGIILLTTAGVGFKEIMTASEKKQFDDGILVTRGNVIEGHRVYAAFQPPIFLRALFEDKVEVLEFIAGKREEWGINQDLWILKNHLKRH